MKVYVLLFHDVWDTGGDPGEDNENGEPEETSIEGVYASYEAAEAAQPSLGDLDPSHAYYTIEEHTMQVCESTPSTATSTSTASVSQP